MPDTSHCLSSVFAPTNPRSHPPYPSFHILPACRRLKPLIKPRPPLLKPWLTPLIEPIPARSDRGRRRVTRVREGARHRFPVRAFRLGCQVGCSFHRPEIQIIDS